MEYRTRSVRLDDEVWAAVQKHELSANKLLRAALGLSATVIEQVASISDDLAEFDKKRAETGQRIQRGARRTERQPLLKPKEWK